MTLAIEGAVNPGVAILERDTQAADILGLSAEDSEALQQRHVQPLGDVAAGSIVEAPAYRVHWGAEEAQIADPTNPLNIAKGGEKFSDKYRAEEDGVRDLAIHGHGMFIKTGVIDKPRYNGGKGWAGVPTRLQQQDPETAQAVMRNLGRRMFEAGYAHHYVDNPAGDEGSNLLIANYIEGVTGFAEHPFATISGKEDMPARPAATGAGAVYATQASMERNGIHEMRAAIQGFGFAGAFYALTANNLRRHENGPQGPIIYTQAIGDVRFAGGNCTPVTLSTTHKDGLPINADMVHAILYDPEDEDVLCAKGDRMNALAQKINRRYPDIELDLRDEDVLTYPGADLLVPSATSNVVTLDIAKKLRPGQIIRPIANNAYCTGVLEYLTQHNIIAGSAGLDSIGGVYMSIREHEGDLERIETGDNYKRLPVSELNADLRSIMRAATQDVEGVAERFGIDIEMAATVVGLARHAMHRNMSISSDVADLLTV